MSETASERLKRSTQEFISNGGDPNTAVLCEIVRSGGDSRLGAVKARITSIDENGVELDNGGSMSYDTIVSIGCKIHMQLKR